MIDLSGKTAIVTGGMNRLSGGVAQQLSAAGADIVLAHLAEDEALANGLARQLTSTRKAQVSFLDPAAHKTQFAQLGPAHIAVITPSYYAFSPFMDASPVHWDEALSRDYEQAVYMAQAAAHHFIAQRQGGRIIFLSSIAATMPLINRSAVGTALAALRALAKMAAVDLAPHRITVNTITLAWVDAEWTSRFLTPAGRAYIEEDIPVGRIGMTQEVGNMCCFLASDLAAYVTGATIPVDGGYSLTRAAAGKLPFPPGT